MLGYFLAFVTYDTLRQVNENLKQNQQQQPRKNGRRSKSVRKR